MPRGLGDELLWWCPSLDDSGNGTNTLNDLSGNGRNGTLVGMDAATDWVSDTTSGGIRALDFDGTNDVVAGPALGITGNAQVAISFWVLWRTSGRGVLGFGNAFSALTAFGAFIGSRATNTVSIEYAGNNGAWSSSGTVASSTWAHVVIQKTPGAINDTSQIAINGTIYSPTTASTSTPNFSDVAFVIGRWASFTGVESWLNGRLDDIRVFNNVLTQSEITKLASKRGYQKPAAAAATLFFFQGF